MVERGRKRNVLPLEDRFGPRLAENAARFRINRTAFKVTVAMHDDQKLDGEGVGKAQMARQRRSRLDHSAACLTEPCSAASSSSAGPERPQPENAFESRSR
jgi:hypothetical protein